MFRGILLGMVLTGCTAVQCPSTNDPLVACTDGIPNLHTVPSTHHVVYRGGQPTAEGWAHLRSLGVTTVVKLNDPTESFNQGEDAPAVAQGMRVLVNTMHPIGGDDPFELLLGPSFSQAAQAVQGIATAPGPVYVHCSHGRDRTGLIVGLYRVFIDGVTPEVAHAEMLADGFRSINRGLDNVWDDLFQNGTDAERTDRQNRFRLLLVPR